MENKIYQEFIESYIKPIRKLRRTWAGCAIVVGAAFTIMLLMNLNGYHASQLFACMHGGTLVAFFASCMALWVVDVVPQPKDLMVHKCVIIKRLMSPKVKGVWNAFGGMSLRGEDRNYYLLEIKDLVNGKYIADDNKPLTVGENCIVVDKETYNSARADSEMDFVTNGTWYYAPLTRSYIGEVNSEREK